VGEQVSVFSIDPATHHVAWASWAEQHLDTCGLKPFSSLAELYGDVYREMSVHTDLVIEEPQVYQGHKNTKGAAPEDILQLAKVVGACLAVPATRYKVYKPNQWKGQVPKGIMWARCVKVLTEQELAIYEACTRDIAPSLRHNVQDAIGLGLKYLGRLAT
jgi:hypothetical protein